MVLLVATATELKVFKYRRNLRENKIEVVDANLSIPSDNNIVSKIVQFKKNGRVFYGGADGHVNELKFEKVSLTSDFLSFI